MTVKDFSEWLNEIRANHPHIDNFPIAIDLHSDATTEPKDITCGDRNVLGTQKFFIMGGKDRFPTAIPA